MGSFDSLVARIGSNASRHGDRVAIVDRGRAIGYAALWDDILRAEAWARQQGIRSGNWVALTVDDQHLNAVLSLALLRMGCSQICLPSFERAETNQRLADRLPLDWQLVSPPLPPVANAVAVPIRSVADFAAVPRSPEGEDAASPQALVVMTGSGTTGRPKLIPFCGAALPAWLSPLPDPATVLHVRTSIEYNIGRRLLFQVLAAGGTFVTSSNGALGDIPAVCARHRVNRILISVYMARQLLAALEGEPGDRPALAGVSVLLMGSKVDAGLFRAARARLTDELAISYGAIELGRISHATARDVAADEDSVGYPDAGVLIQIVDADHRPVPAGVPGLVGVKSPACTRGYLFDDELNARHFRDGWFYPGDVGVLTADGMLVFRGRADDVIMLNSINIFPEEIENSAATFPGVRECAAFAIRSAAHGEIPALAVVGTTALDTEALLGFCRQALGIRAPRKVILVPSIPRNALGKVRRRELSEGWQRPAPDGDPQR
jgi:acyl-coenzyme A synthetase/AMP-(fatty) acid ligase